MSAPRAASASAHERPIPREPPVISALPVISLIASDRERAPEPALVEAHEVGDEVVHRRVAGRDRLDLELSHAAGAEVLADLLPRRIPLHHPGIDLEQLLLAVAHVDERLELPVGGVLAELVAAVEALDDVDTAALDDDAHVLAVGQDDPVLPRRALLQQLHVGVEAVRVL